MQHQQRQNQRRTRPARNQQPNGRRPTIDDVARMAGVSKSTVSRVIVGHNPTATFREYVHPETRQQVEEAIAKLGYRPNALARGLVTSRTNTLGLIISDVSNPFYPEVIKGVEDEAIANGYDVFLCNTNYEVERGLRFVRSLIAKQVDGVLIMSSSMSDEWINELQRHNIATVVLDWEACTACEAVGTISVDFDAGIREAVDHLVALGHRRFAHVTGPLQLRTSRMRRDAFLKALARHGVKKKNVAMIEGNLRIEGGAAALDELLKLPQRPTAIFAANDLTAIGMIWAARDRNLRIPQDFSIIGLDDIPLAAQISPSLTTVVLPKATIASTAMTMLLELLRNEGDKNDTPPRSEVETHLVKRNSTATAQDS